MRYKVKAVDVAGCDWIHVDVISLLVLSWLMPCAL